MSKYNKRNYDRDGEHRAMTVDEIYEDIDARLAALEERLSTPTVIEDEDTIGARNAELTRDIREHVLSERLQFTSCQKADVEAQVLELEEQNAALDEEKVCCLPDDISARLRRAPVMPFEEVTLDRPERRWEIRERRPDGSVYVTYGDKFIDAITEAWRNCKVT